MTFATNRSVTGLMNIRVDAEPDVIRRRKSNYIEPYTGLGDWVYNLDMYDLKYLGDALHYEVHNFSVEEGEW